MTNVCPSCQTPIEADGTLGYSPESGTVVCGKCGAALPEQDGTASFAAPLSMDSAAGRRVANFELQRVLGRGGFGEVWLAHDVTLGRQVALKLPRMSGDDSTLLHEAKTAARLRHPNIVAVYEVGVENGQVYIASEFIDGEDLRADLEAGRLEASRAAKLCSTLARAIQHAHDQHVVHRDLKPANIIMNAAGDPFIADFGIAKRLSVDETISTDGAVVGTVSYMSPEQARGATNETDHRSDIYSLGVILFEMVTGFRPFRGNARAVIRQKLDEDAPSPRKLLPSLPKDIETICLKCLEREPGKRYGTAAELADELDRFMQGVPIRARPISRMEKGWRWCRRRPAITALACGLLLSLTAGLCGVTFFWRQAERNAAEARASLYRSNMHLAGKLWERGDVAGLRETLDRHAPTERSSEHRGFEWHYYDALTKPIKQHVQHGDVVTDVAVSRDGGLFASAGADRSIRVWNAKSGELVRTMATGEGRIESIEFSPIDDRLASAHTSGALRIWNPVQHDRPTRELSHGAGLTRLRFSPDGRFVATAGRRGRLRLWKLAEDEPVASLDEGRNAVTSLRFSPDGKLVAFASEDGSVAIWDPFREASPRQWSIGSAALTLTFVDGGRSLVTGSGNGALQTWDVESGERQSNLFMDGGAIGDVEFFAESDLLAAARTSGELTILDRELRPIRVIVTHALTHGTLALSADGKHLAAASGDGSVKLISTAELQRRDLFWHASHVREVRFIGDHELAACDGEGAVRIWNFATGSVREIAPASDREMLTLAVRRHGGDLLAIGGMSREIELLSWRSNERHTIGLPALGVSALAFSPDGKRLAAGGRDGAVRLFDPDRREPLHEIPASDVQVNDLVFTRDGRLVVAFSKGRIEILDARTGTTSQSPIELDEDPLALAFVRGGNQLVVSSATGNLHFIDLSSSNPSPRRLKTIKAHSSRINAVAVFPAGDRIVSGGRDKELRIWDVESGELVASLTGHDRQVFSIAISHDGHTIASAGLAGDIRIWRSE